jgi:hypothetical protein
MLLDEAQNQYGEADLRVGLLLLVAAGLTGVMAQPGCEQVLLTAY